MPSGFHLVAALVDCTFYSRTLARLYCLSLYQTAEFTFLHRERIRIHEEDPDYDLSWVLYLRECEGERYLDLLQEQFHVVWQESRRLYIASDVIRYPGPLPPRFGFLGRPRASTWP